MDSKAELIREFYAGLPKDRVKLETFDHGFGYLEEMLAGGMILEYGERVLFSKVHKYKFSNVPEWRMDAMLESHVRKECNVCLYFKEASNILFCFNMDKGPKFNTSEMLPELGLAVSLLREILANLGCEPLVIESGKGFHLWCRLAAAEGNAELYNFMLRAMAKALHGLHQKGLDHQRINVRFYPDPRALDRISLRLFGSDHMKNGRFSQVLARDGLLDEEASWAAFEAHLRLKTIPPGTFRDACGRLAG